MSEMIIDLHCDTITRLMSCEDSEKTLSNNDFHITISKLKQSNYMLQTFAIFTPYDCKEGRENFVARGIDRFYQEINNHSDVIAVAYNYEDIISNYKSGKISAMLSLEEGDVMNQDISKLSYYYDLGVRMIGLTWNYPNAIGYPNIDATRSCSFDNIDTKNGLTKYGIEYVKEMERLKMIIDVSHASDAVFYDVLKYTKKPFIASHSNARKITDVGRNLSDDMIDKISKRGGVIGINFCSLFTTTKDHVFGYISDLVAHIEYIVSIGGIDVVALGSDFDGIGDDIEITNASKMHLLFDALKVRGFSDEDISKIAYKNICRVYKDVL